MGSGTRLVVMGLCGCISIAAAALSGCSDTGSAPAGVGGLPLGAATTAQIVHGRYIVTAQGACAECHSAGGDNPNDPNWLAGYIADPAVNPNQTGKFSIGPFTFYSANLTPDAATGLGNWTPQQIFNALRTGHDAAGNFLCPPMPWPVFRNMTDSDLWSIVAYLRSIKPVSNAVPEGTGPGVPAGQHPDCAPFYANLAPLPPYPAANEIGAR